MPKVGLTADQKSHSIFDTENFKMKTGQKARVLLIDSEFDVEWVHWVDGVEGGRNFICQGDYNTMMKDGVDPHCKFCQVVESGGVQKAKRKFVTLLVVYRTNSKGQILTPVSCDVQPWIFGNDKFNDLYSKKEQWGDLRSHDIGIECLVEQYQRFSMNILPEAIWLQDDATKALVTAAYKEVRDMYGKDTRMLLGRDITDPEKLTAILNEATGSGVVPDYASTGSIEAMFSDAPKLAPTPVVEVDFSELLGDSSSPSMEVETEIVVAKTETVSSVSDDPLSTGTAVTGTAVDFDALLAD